MDRNLKLWLIGLLAFTGLARADQTIFQPMIFSTGSSLTINSGITVDFAAGSIVDFTGATVTGLAGGGSTNAFGTITVAGQSNVVAETAPDTLTLVAGSNVTLTTNATTDTLTIAATGGGGGAPTTVDYLVGTADGTLSNEIVVGTSPGGELGGTWASPTIDDSLSVTGWTLVTPTIAAISNLTGNGFVKTGGGIGTLSVDTATYLTSASISDTAYASTWDTVTTIAPSKNAIRDWGFIFDPDYDGKVEVLDLTAGLVKTSSTGVVSTAVAGTDYQAAGAYLTANQPISLTGDVTGGPAATSIATTYNNAVPTAKAGVLTGGTTDQLLAKNSNTNYDLKWVTPAGGGNVSNSGTPTVDQLGIWVTATTIKGLTTLPATNFPALTGDVTTTAGGLGTTIGANKVTLGMMATMATDSILGRATAAVGNVEVLSALPFAYTGDVTKPVDSNVLTIADSVTVTGWTLGSSSITAISNLTGNGFVKTSGGIGTLSIDTATYLTTATAASTYQPLDADLTTLAGVTPTTVGLNFLDLANPSTITFPKITAGNDVVAESAATFRTSIGAAGGTGTASGTNTGDQTSIVGITGTTAQFNTALTDGDFATGGGTATGTNTGDQTLVGLGGQPLDTDLTALAGITGVQGDVIYRDATGWTKLAAGTNGNQLTTHSTGANPTWDAPGSGGGGTPGGSTLQLQYNNAGAFGGMSGTAWDDTNRSLAVTGATVTTSKPILDAAQTWNAGGVTFTGLKLNVTSTASDAGSLLADFQTGGVSQVNIRKDGYVQVLSGVFWPSPNHLISNVGGSLGITSGSATLFSNGGVFWALGTSSGGLVGANNAILGWQSGSAPVGSGPDTAFARNAAGVVEINNGTAGQYRDLLVRNLTVSGTCTGCGGAGGGNVSNSGTPTVGQYGRWVTATTIEGVAASTVRTDLGLVIGTNVQAWDTDLDVWATKTPYAGTVVVTTGKTFTSSNTLTLAGTDGSTLTIGAGGTLGTAAYTASTAYQAADGDLTTWAGITPGTGVGTFLATPSSANLRSALTDENGTGPALFNDATSPDFTTSVTVDSVAVPTISNTATLTNKRISPRVTTITSNATLSPSADNDDIYAVSALATAVTTINAPSGTPVDGQKLIIRVISDSSVRAIAGWNAIYRFSSSLAAPSTTVASTTHTWGFMYNATAVKWDCLAQAANP